MTEKKVLWVQAVDHQLLATERERIREALDSSPLAKYFEFIVTDKFVKLMTHQEVLDAIYSMREGYGKLPLKYRIKRKLGLM